MPSTSIHLMVWPDLGSMSSLIAFAASSVTSPRRRPSRNSSMNTSRQRQCCVSDLNGFRSDRGSKIVKFVDDGRRQSADWRRSPNASWAQLTVQALQALEPGPNYPCMVPTAELPCRRISVTNVNAELQVKDRSAPSTADSFWSWARKPTRTSSRASKSRFASS
jgi:hypothetical protein